MLNSHAPSEEGSDFTRTVVDQRESLVNEGAIGAITEIQTSGARIAQLSGIMFDVDRDLIKQGPFTPVAPKTPEDLFVIVQSWLRRHPVLAKAQVRSSGRGLHVLLMFDAPVIFSEDAERERWKAIVKVVQSALPIDPGQPGITAITRPVDSINSKNDGKVSVLEEGEPVTQKEVERLAQSIVDEPFKVVWGIINGEEQRTHCPFCQKPDSKLSVQGFEGQCYGCGKVSLKVLYESLLMARSEGAGKDSSRGAALANRLLRARRGLQSALKPGARRLPILRGVTQTGAVDGSQENYLHEATEHLIASKQVFMYCDDVVLELPDQLYRLTNGQKSEPQTPGVLANIFLCESGGNTPRQFSPPKSLVHTLLSRRTTRSQLPAIKTYAKRPLFDNKFELRGPGWHAEPGILVHGVEVESDLDFEAPVAEAGVDRLPPHLKALLSDFCFRSDADLANALGSLLTGVLANHFIAQGHPVFLLDGNQPGVGKTLFTRIVGLVLDGDAPPPVPYTPNDEELQKHILSTIRDQEPSLIVLDNAKRRAGEAINSVVIESQSMAETISLRILGTSNNYQRPNDLLWFLTMNNTKLSPDLASRGVPIRFVYEGNPGDRSFSNSDPLTYARKHRQAILGELFGMVDRWKQAGREEHDCKHRCGYWAKIVGGILQRNGFPEFLTNQDQAAEEFNAAADELYAIAEKAVLKTDFDYTKAPGTTARGWVDIVDKAGVRNDLMEAKSEKRRSTIVGQLLSQHVGRSVELDDGVVATLCTESGRSRSKNYYFLLQENNGGDGERGERDGPRN